jgi:prepilin-type N-terminal cleavage/methylation domain-containing protein
MPSFVTRTLSNVASRPMTKITSPSTVQERSAFLAEGERRSSAPCQAGFTVLELLVVVCIVAVLASLVLAVQNRARESGRRSACISNLRQIGMAMRMYAADNDGLGTLYGTQTFWGHATGLSAYFYHDGAIFDLLKPYGATGRVWFCPSDPYAGQPRRFKDCCIDHRRTSYHILGFPHPLDILGGPPQGPGTLGLDELAWHGGGQNILTYTGRVHFRQARHGYPPERHPGPL